LRALLDREHIIEAYQQYAPEYNQMAKDILAKFLEASVM